MARPGTPQFGSRWPDTACVCHSRLRGRALGYYCLRDVFSMMEKGRRRGKAGETAWDWLQEDRALNDLRCFCFFITVKDVSVMG